MQLKTLFVLWFCLFSFFLHGSREEEKSPCVGKVIVLYGPHCGGKSTLAEELLKKLPEPYEIVSKRKYIDARRAEYLVEVAGDKPIDHQEMLCLLESLPEDKKKDFSRKAIEDTLLDMRARAKRGENLIFPVCFKRPMKWEIFEGIPHLSVLVHIPLSIVSQRELVRTEQRKAFAVQSFRRTETLLSYVSLYTPVRHGGKSHIDMISYQDVIDFVYESLKKEIDSELLTSLPEVIAHFGLHYGKKVKIAPRFSPDLVVNSGVHSPEELAEQIKRVLYPFSERNDSED